MTPTLSPELQAKIEQEAFTQYPLIKETGKRIGYKAGAESYALKWEQAETRIEQLTDILDEARLQIEYLHYKFADTGSGNNILSRIEEVLTTKQTIDEQKNVPGL